MKTQTLTTALQPSAETPIWSAHREVDRQDAMMFSRLQAPGGRLLHSLETARLRAMRSVSAASTATDHLAFYDANAALSELYIRNLSTVKVIGKGVQCVEKLLNLQ